ncbi:MAG: hypothetical protein KDK69_05900 [Chlamydiia bacterium]|nr:hypothetical protein [Chlamydiia bacterium]
MQQDINYQKAMDMLNLTLQEMKKEMSEIDGMSLKGDKKKMAKYMHNIMEKIEKKIKKYSKSQDHGDFNSICRELEALQPSFILNYNEICYNSGLETLNDTLEEMEGELASIDKKKYSGPKGDKAKHLHEIYDQLSSIVEKFASTHEHNDFELALKQMEELKPKFMLTYNELAS